ncbi:hypothetical protein BGM09_04725 [Streptomyces sp. CBMA29]|nr:hypothetical protein [Streptomyces sp. CBMA29]MBD0738253.1 hypothetical protein [Streptomyces sp. CBMA29]
MTAAGIGVLFFAAVAVIGVLVDRRTHSVLVPWPPLMAQWSPHVGPGTPAAVAVAALVVAYGPVVAGRLPWKALLWSAWAAAMAWTWSLALVDGWRVGIANRLSTPSEYVRGVGHFDDVGAALRDFTHHILADSPAPWETHVIGHPPGAVLTFVGLDRIGLGGGAWAGVFCITVGSSFAAAALLTLGILGGERTARAAAPFLVLAPGAVWVGVSADGYFAAVTAWAIALLAVAATRTSAVRGAVAGLASGLLFGAAVYLSYGLVLMALPAALVLICTRKVRPLPYALLGFTIVVTAFTVAGFNWWEGYGLLKIRYFQGYGGVRPYAYWLWGDLAAALAAAGLAALAGMRRVLVGVPGSLRSLPHGTPPTSAATVLLPCAFLLAMVAADLSGMSKAETERIWLPFVLWLPAAAGLLPPRDHRGWLIAQAAAALLVNHLLLTLW